jgi:AcrR family transcriptional regulator
MASAEGDRDEMAAAASRPRQRTGGRSARVRAAVLDATLATLAEDGDAFTIPRVAARAGVHETSIYRRWGTREALIVDAVTARIGAEMPIPDTGSLRDDLVQFLTASIRFLAAPLGTQLVRATATTSEVGATGARRAYWPGRLERIAVMFARAAARGEIPATGDHLLAAEALLAPLYFRLLISHAPMDETLAPHLADLVLHGVALQPR